MRNVTREWELSLMNFISVATSFPWLYPHFRGILITPWEWEFHGNEQICKNTEMRINYQSAVCLQQNTFLEFFFINISLAILENTNYGIREERTYLHASGFFATGMRGMDCVRSMCSVYRIPVTTDVSCNYNVATSFLVSSIESFLRNSLLTITPWEWGSRLWKNISIPFSLHHCSTTNMKSIMGYLFTSSNIIE